MVFSDVDHAIEFVVFQYPHEIPAINIKNPRGIGEEEVDRSVDKMVITQPVI